MADVPVS